MKRIISLALVLVLCMSMAACGKKECNHEFTASVKDGKVTLSCRLCAATASADVEIPKEIVEKEVIKEVIKEIEKPVEKTVIKEVVKPVVKTEIKEVEKLVEVPVYLSEEDRMNAEKNELLNYYLENYEKMDFLRNYIAENYYKDVDPDDLMEAAYAGMVDSLGDPYSHYAPPAESEDYTNALSRAYSGIGIVISPDEDNNVIITSTVKGSPAEAAGIVEGDMIERVDGVSMLGQGIDVAADKIRGEIGTSVTVDILRNGQSLSFNVVRRQISESTVSYGFFDFNTGYIELSGFNSSTVNEFATALATLEYYGIKQFVLDVRNNGGGMVNVAWIVADMLMDEGNMTYIQDRSGYTEYYPTFAGRTPMKYVILCNENSASATEMLCGGVQDSGSGKIVGTKTYGKGVVQMLMSMPDGSSLNLTQYQYFTPNGNVIHGVGITPDYIVDLDDECFDERGALVYDKQLVKAIEVLEAME